MIQTYYNHLVPAKELGYRLHEQTKVLPLQFQPIPTLNQYLCLCTTGLEIYIHTNIKSANFNDTKCVRISFHSLRKLIRQPRVMMLQPQFLYISQKRNKKKCELVLSFLSKKKRQQYFGVNTAGKAVQCGIVLTLTLLQYTEFYSNHKWQLQFQ